MAGPIEQSVSGNVRPLKFLNSSGLCPWCKTVSQANWRTIEAISAGNRLLEVGAVSSCVNCHQFCFWTNDNRMVWPSTLASNIPHTDTPADIAEDFREADRIMHQSPRSAAALLRLCLQKLCIHLGGKGKNINSDIGTLYANGLQEHLAKAMDVLRVVGNEQVHPGQMDIRDTPEIVNSLFSLFNIVVEQTIGQKKMIDSLFELLPEEKKSGIEQRNTSKPEAR